MIKTTKEIQNFLTKKDKKFKQIIAKYGDFEYEENEDYFVRLTSSIVGQQLSNKVADVIWQRLINLLNEISFKNILKTPDEKLRSCGLSFNKISYIKNLANAVKNKELDFANFKNYNDAEIIEKLTKIKGIGKWTAEMFLMFSMGHEDIFSFGDAGLNSALHKLLNKEELTKKEIIEYTEKFSPYRSYLSIYLWATLENT